MRHVTVRRTSLRLEVEHLEDRSLPAGTLFLNQPVLPVIDPVMAAHLQAVLAWGQSLGNRPDVFIKVGDSISASPSFLTPLGAVSYNPRNPAVVGSYTNLAGTINYFRSQSVNATGENSFNHVGLAAQPGWLSAFLLDPHDNPPATPGSGIVPSLTPLENEIRLTHPAIALIMIGTNDVSFNVPPAVYQANLLRIGQLALQYGVIPVFSSIPNHPLGGPSNLGQVVTYNQIVSNVANALNVPFWNYWAALKNLPNAGISSDWVHPSVYPGGAGVFTTQALNYGYNQRNLTAVEVLQEIKNSVIGVSFSARSVVLTPADANYVQNLYLSLLGRSATAAEVSAWEQVLLDDGTRMNIAEGVWQSPEHYQHEVTQDYETVLRRAPGPGETDPWVADLQAGQTEEQVLAQFLSSPELLSGRTTPFAQISGIYQEVLNRAPQANEVTLWENQIQEGVSLDSIALAIVTSAEAYQNDIDAYYQTFLHRQATGQDRSAWLGGPLTLAGLGESILASDEFFAQG